MNNIRSWREQKVMLKWRFPFLCDEDFVIVEGKKDHMFHKLSMKLKKTMKELEFIFAELQRF